MSPLPTYNDILSEHWIGLLSSLTSHYDELEFLGVHNNLCYIIRYTPTSVFSDTVSTSITLVIRNTDNERS